MMSLMAWWITELPGGRAAYGSAPNEAEARRMIDEAQSQGRASVTWNERADRWRWTVVVDGGKTSHGWADSEAEGWQYVREALQRPYRSVRYRGPRCRFELPHQ
jgi:hypothetical protein